MINEACLTQLFPGSTTLEEFESLGGTKTRIKIGVHRSTSPGNMLPEVELTEYTYDRLDLATFFRQSGTQTIAGKRLPYTTVEFAADIAKLNDIVFDVSDLVHFEMDRYGQEYIIQANPKSLRWVGSLKIRLSNTLKKDLGTFSTQLEFPTANRFPVGNDGTKISGTYYVTGYDFTPHREYLKNIKVGDFFPDTKRFAAILKKVTGQPWTTSESAVSHNVCYDVLNGQQRFKVVYHGIPLPRYTPRKDKRMVLVIELSSTKCLDVVGQLLIHYD
ncbi:virion structural protein [Pseudomonas phage PhiPA3]|uniref:Virion structural protein n=1 Tax=Pseudomonas phage PhiPA3 TaxID=998086 RepID=F8SK19_BPPA3|nr:virion structural protein [Pseudomonas phage PhiPA3]AEH03569.1 virion structural protein [Pseudomonas phage PhiPA3]